VLTDQNQKKLVVLGTGGTIAGSAALRTDNIGYTAAQVGVAELLAAVPGMSAVMGGCELLSEQLAQVDSKDMGFDVWQALAVRVGQLLADSAVQGVVITHGTDTLEETAFFLQAVLPESLISSKPVVLTCAMRPASAQNPDGPQNLLDAVSVALTAAAHGVVVVCAGTVHSAWAVQKSHTYKVDAFSSGDAGPLACVEEAVVRLFKAWPSPLRGRRVAADLWRTSLDWPRVEIVMNYAGCGGEVVDALLQASSASPLSGLVVAGTGNGTIHVALAQALRRAQARGVKVVRSTRCANGRVLPVQGSEFEATDDLSPVKARIALMLELMTAQSET
jgi:L-asparaginase